MKDVLVKTENLSRYFKTGGGLLHAVDNISLEIGKGQTLGVVGESGCGKSTLGRMLIRLIDPTSGKIFFDGKDITNVKGRQLKDLRKDMQIIFQDPFASLDGRMTVFEQIAEPLKVFRIFRDKNELFHRVQMLMDLTGIARRFIDFYPHELDGGRRQRVGIARALALNPRLIICDEPVSSLDVSIQAQILNLLKDLQEEMKISYLFITHDLMVVRYISDEIMVMYCGQCVEKASSDALFEKPLHPYTQALLACVPLPDIRKPMDQSILVKGEIYNPVNPKPGCRFADRCRYCTDNCRNQDFSLKEISSGSGHYVACRLYT